MSTVKPKHCRVISENKIRGGVEYTLEYPRELFKQAACVNTDPEAFFPDMMEHSKYEMAVPRKVCASCPVREACLEWALCHEKEGIWGGLDSAERNRMRKARGWLFSSITIGMPRGL